MADKDIPKLKVVDLKRKPKICGFNDSGNENELTAEMDKNESTFQNERVAKKRHLNHEEAEQSSSILEMPVEIIEYIFDYLDLKNLSAVSATCKQMQQLAGRVYQRNYSGFLPKLGQSEMDWNVRRNAYDQEIVIDIEHFVSCVNQIKIVRTEHIKYLNNSRLKFHQLKKLTISHRILNLVDEEEALKEALNKIEYLNISFCYLEGSSLENMLSLSPNLKFLSINYSDGELFLERNFPMLEHLELTPMSILPITTILTHNPNIRKFGTNVRNLWENRFSMEAAEVKLEDLAIQIGGYDLLLEEEGRLSFRQLLNELHQNGVYKRLNLFQVRDKFDQNVVDMIANLTAVNRLRVGRESRFDYVALSALVHIEDVTFPDSRFITDIETVATNQENLKFIYFGISNTSHVKLFMGRNSKLKRIQIDWFMDEGEKIEDEKVLNLIELNKQRAKLLNAKKITLFVQESVYLATKRANRVTDLDFIELRRTDTLYEREFDFKYPEVFSRKPYYYG